MRALAIAAVVFTLGSANARAATRYVPTTQYPTIQSAVTGAACTGDVVLVMPGVYPENVVADGVEILIIGVGGAASTTVDRFELKNTAPTQCCGGGISGFTISNGVSATGVLQDFHILACDVLAPVGITTVGSAANVILRNDRFDANVTVNHNGQPIDGALVTVRDCHFNTALLDLYSNSFADVLDNDFSGSSMIVLAEIVRVNDNTVDYTGAVAIDVRADSQQGQVRRNSVRNAASGIGIRVEGSSYAGIDCSGNRVEACGTGISAIFDAQPADRVENNIVCRCNRDGIVVDGNGDYLVAGNTVTGCLGSALVLLNLFQGERIERNNLVSNGQLGNPSSGGLRVTGNASTASFTCNNVWNNLPANYIPGPAPIVGGNISLDPRFCDPTTCEATVQSTSPLLPANNSCGVLIGAVGWPGPPCLSPEAAQTGSAGAPAGSPGLTEILPNPFESTATVHYSLPNAERVDLSIWNASGRLVRVLRGGALESAGDHAVVWDGREERGGRAAPGVYFVRLTAGSTRSARKALVLR